MPKPKPRLAFVVSHPIQYYVPLYQRLAQRDDIDIKVFFTWHDARSPVTDHGFKQSVAWDIPLNSGYAFELVPNVAYSAGTHHFRGLRNPELMSRVRAWRPDWVHVTGYAHQSHLLAILDCARAGLPVIFRGDSHLLDAERPLKLALKKLLLSRLFSRFSMALYVGQANRDYFRAFGIPDAKLRYCPHSIDVARFSEPDARLEQEAAEWRHALGIGQQQRVLLFAGKFEAKKQPLPLMQACLRLDDPRLVVLMVGDGETASEVRGLAAAHPRRFHVLPFQNQSRMPVVYRLGDIFTLPSAWGETWGLAVNEALACGRPVLISDKVGCAQDVLRQGLNGECFRSGDWDGFAGHLRTMLGKAPGYDGAALRREAYRYDISATESHLMQALATPNRSPDP